MSAAYFDALSRLVALLHMPDATDDERLAAVQQLTTRAQDDALLVHIEPEGADADLAVSDDAIALRALLRRHRVRRLVIRRGASARELAQFAGLLDRTGDAATEPRAATRPDAGPEAGALVRGMDELCIWNVQVECHAADADTLATLTPALRDAVERVTAAATPEAITDAYADVAAACAAERASGDATSGARSAPQSQVARVLAHLARVRETDARQCPRAEADAHNAGVDQLIAAEIDAAVAAIADGTVPDAWRAVRAAADRAVPLLLTRLGVATTIDERRRCFNAILDAGGDVDALLDSMRDPRWFVVRNVALILGELREPGAVRPLARALQASDPRVREAAAIALTRIDRPASTYALVGALRDPHVAVRQLAARALQRAPAHEVPVSVGLIMSRLRVEADGAVAHELIDALRRLETPEAYGALAALAAETGRANGGPLAAVLRAAALRALGRVPTPQLVQMLRELVDGPDARVRRAALHVAPQLLTVGG